MMKMNAVKVGCGAMAGLALALTAAVQVCAADLHSILKKGEEQDYTIVYLDGQTFGSNPRVLSDGHVYVVTNDVSFTGKDGSDRSITGESGLTVADKEATVYIYIADGAKLTCTGGNGRNAETGGTAPAPGYVARRATDEGVERNTYPFDGGRLSAGGGGACAGGGGAGILVPESSKLAVFGPGQLVATGGKGGNAAVGGQGSRGLYAAATWYISYAGISVASSPYKGFDSNISDATAGWSGTTTSGTVGCDCTAQPGAGGGGGGGAGGGGAAIGSEGASGSAGTAGGVNTKLWNTVVEEPGEKQLTPQRASSAPSLGGMAAAAGTVFFSNGFVRTLTAGSGGVVSGSKPQSRNNATYTCQTYNTMGGVTDYNLYFTEGQPGGSGGTGGNGCEIGCGGNGGAGGEGGYSGSLADSLWGGKKGPAGESQPGGDGAIGSSGAPIGAQDLSKEKQPYGKISFAGSDTNTYCFGRANQIDVPSPKDRTIYLGWRVETPLSKALPGVPENARLLANDVAFYRERDKVELACGVAGDATLTAWTLTVKDGGEPMPFDIKTDDPAYGTYLSTKTTLAEMNDALATPVKNGLPLWKSLVLGFNPEDPTAAIRLSVAVSNNPARVWIDAPSLSGWTGKYAVVPVFLPLSKTNRASEVWTKRTEGQGSKLPLSLDIPSEPREYYKMSIAFKPE